MFDIQRILAETSVRRVEHRVELPSTNDFALDHLRTEGAADLPLLVLADRQISGRGRGERAWWSSDGALTFSLVVPFDELAFSVQRRPMLALVAGLAVCDAIIDFAPEVSAGLKWPNDVFLNGRKVCGILIESPARPANVAVVGIGVNVNNSFREAPEEIRQRAVSLIEVTQDPFDLTEVLVRILRNFHDHTQSLVERPEAIVDRWRSRCLLSGRRICVRSGSRIVHGYCEGIDRNGCLKLRTGDGTERFASGTIEGYSSAVGH